jgi:hypothetical protein
MEHGKEDFSVYHRGELREVLIMLEGNDGGFELLGHGAAERAGDEIEWAAVRSSGSDTEYLLVHDRAPRPGTATCWHLADPAEEAAVRRTRLGS